MEKIILKNKRRCSGFYFRYERYNILPDNLITNKQVHNKPKRNKNVYQYDMQGFFLNGFSNATLAEKNTGVRSKNIISSANGHRKSAGNYYWLHEKYDQLSLALLLKLKNRTGESFRKKIIQKTLNDKIIKEFDSSVDAAKYYNYNHRCINNAASGRVKTYKGYIWEYLK